MLRSNAPASVVEGRIGDDRVAHRLVADRETEAVDLELDEIVADEALQRLVDDAELLRLLRVDRAAEQAAQPVELASAPAGSPDRR